MSPAVLLGAAVLGAGMLFCFAGERLFRLFLVLSGIGAGVFAAMLFVGETSLPVRVIAVALAGVLGGASALLLYRVSFLLAGCAAGWGIASGLLGLSPLISGLAAAATGLLGFFGARYFMALASALWGAAAAASGARILLAETTRYSPPPEAILAATGVLALLGALAQVRRLRKSRAGG